LKVSQLQKKAKQKFNFLLKFSLNCFTKTTSHITTSAGSDIAQFYFQWNNFLLFSNTRKFYNKINPYPSLLHTFAIVLYATATKKIKFISLYFIFMWNFYFFPHVFYERVDKKRYRLLIYVFIKVLVYSFFFL
jgi:hypothetical protein